MPLKHTHIGGLGTPILPVSTVTASASANPGLARVGMRLYLAVGTSMTYEQPILEHRVAYQVPHNGSLPDSVLPERQQTRRGL